MPDELHGCLLHRHDGSLRHAVGIGPDDGDLRRRHGLLHDLRLLHDLHRNNLLHGDDLRRAGENGTGCKQRGADRKGIFHGDQ